MVLGKPLGGLLKNPCPPIQPLDRPLSAGAAGNLVPARTAVEQADQRALGENKVLGPGVGRFKADRCRPVGPGPGGDGIRSLSPSR